MSEEIRDVTVVSGHCRVCPILGRETHTSDCVLVSLPEAQVRICRLCLREILRRYLGVTSLANFLRSLLPDKEE
jgi:hypothetical protein